MVKRDKVEDLAKRKLKINRVPENTKREFIELAEQEFCGDYGMTLKFIWEEFKKTNTIYEHFDMKLNEILNRLMNSGEDNDKEEIKLMSGKKIQKGGE